MRLKLNRQRVQNVQEDTLLYFPDENVFRLIDDKECDGNKIRFYSEHFLNGKYRDNCFEYNLNTYVYTIEPKPVKQYKPFKNTIFRKTI